MRRRPKVTLLGVVEEREKKAGAGAQRGGVVGEV